MSHLRAAIVSLVVLTVVTGVVYPVVVTAIAQLVFPRQANGSLVVKDGTVVGSALIGQPFDDPKYFWGRPSATSPFGYNAAASSGSKLPMVEPGKKPARGMAAISPGNSAIAVKSATTGMMDRCGKSRRSRTASSRRKSPEISTGT